MCKLRAVLAKMSISLSLMRIQPLLRSFSSYQRCCSEGLFRPFLQMHTTGWGLWARQSVWRALWVLSSVCSPSAPSGSVCQVEEQPEGGFIEWEGAIFARAHSLCFTHYLSYWSDVGSWHYISLRYTLPFKICTHYKVIHHKSSCYPSPHNWPPLPILL